MARRIKRHDVLFLDTGYAIALSAPSDQLHKRALRFADELEASGAKLVTTRAVVFEIGNALAKRRNRSSAIRLLRSLEAEASIEIVPLSEELGKKAFDLFSSRADKEWGLIDCASFVVMNERNITNALTPDKHFEQAGFCALLRRE